MTALEQAVYKISFWTLGQLGILYPDLMFVFSTNTYARMVMPGYLGVADYNQLASYGFKGNDLIALCLSKDLGLFWAGVTLNSNTKSITLIPLVNPGSVSLPVVSGDLAKFIGTTGEVSDASIAASDVELKNGVVAQQSANIGGSGAGPIDITVSGATATSIAIASVLSSSNPCAILHVTTATGKISVTFTADPGASAIINYVVYKAGQ